ncbi:hypothetical protein BGAL_0114g00250 [Botrytis galanthina]|uniref:Uncharacterized protein n=1 Tax=Botrytis galanthina TaxID=278940 RepID=A0A4S8R0S2_9HELO|nr:hypothetical protein BGAL_0114g00250 [Botrytis galanthina]
MMTVYYLHVRSSSEFDTHDDHQQSQIDIPNPYLPLPHPVSAATNETAGQIVSSDFTGPTQTKTRQEKREDQGKKEEKKGELVSRLGDEAHELNLPHEYQTEKEDFGKSSSRVNLPKKTKKKQKKRRVYRV